MGFGFAVALVLARGLLGIRGIPRLLLLIPFLFRDLGFRRIQQKLGDGRGDAAEIRWV